MLVTNICKKIDIPHEPGHHAVIRRLSWRQLRDAKRAQEAIDVEGMRQTGAELIKVFMEAANSKDEKGQEDARAKARRIQAERDAMPQTYDRDLVLRSGLASWSYDVPVGQDGVLGTLDEVTAAFLHGEIIGFSRDHLTEEQLKNVSGSSIGS